LRPGRLCLEPEACSPATHACTLGACRSIASVPKLLYCWCSFGIISRLLFSPPDVEASVLCAFAAIGVQHSVDIRDKAQDIGFILLDPGEIRGYSSRIMRYAASAR